MKNNGKKITIALFALLVSAFFAFPTAALSLSLAAGGTNYYICYESDNYRVRASNRMSESGGIYTVSPYMSRGDRFVISDGEGHLWGGENGEPVVVTDSGRVRYEIRFNPNGFEGGGFVEVDYYAPEAFTLKAGGQSVEMTYLRAQTLREEYYAYVTLGGGETLVVAGEDGTEYGETGAGSDGATVALGGKYRVAFTADGDNLFADDKYLVFSEYPTLYLLCEENGFAPDAGYLLERDESVVAYEQYKSEIDVPTKDFELRFSVLDDDTKDEYKPSSTGKVTVKDKGRYEVHYSPDHIYSASGDERIHVELRRVEEFYDGYFVLGDFNGFTFIDGDEFETEYGLKKNDDETTFDEYKLTLNISEDMLGEFDGKVEFYISDGASIYRRPTGANIVIDEAGEYELSFSPEHDYGRGYRYRYVRIGDSVVRETVTIRSARQLADILALMTSPEYSLGKTFLLAADVDLGEVEYTPALVFAGEFDGMYRKISGVRERGDTSNFLFREVTKDGTLRRLSVDVKLDSGERGTALVGTNNGLMEEVYVTGNVFGDDYVGAVAAVNASGGKINSCGASAEISGVMNVGGIVGFNAGEIKNSTFSGNVNSSPKSSSESSSMLNLGGIAGYSTGNVLACETTGNVGCRQGRYVGGIVGLSSGGVFSCKSGGVVSGASYAGGIIGYYGRFDGNKTGDSDLVDYLTGGRFEEWLDEYFGSDGSEFEESEDSGVHEVYYCISSGEVYSDSYGGGIAGHAGATALTVNGCVFTGKIDVRSSHAGGIVGDLGEGTVKGCLSLGDVTAGASYAGGIVGQAVGAVLSSQSSAYVAGRNYVGGIAGGANRIEGCVSYAFVETLDAESKTGMIAGEASLALSKYNYYLSSDESVGGIDGVTYGSENDYKACALSLSEMMSVGMLSDKLYGISADDFLAGENEPRYPVPRTLAELTEPEIYSDKAAFEAAFNTVEELLNELSDRGGKAVATVTFYTYDFDREEHKRAATFRLRVGEGIAESDLPLLTEEDGCFVRWDRDDFSCFTENTRVFELFDRVKTTLASDGEMNPLVLVEGKFHSDAELTLEYNGEYVSLKFTREGKAVSYGDVVVKYRVDDVERYEINLVRGGEIVSANATVVGDYLCFTLSEGWAFAAVDTSASLFPLWITLASVGSALAVALAFGIPLAVLRFGKKKSPKNDTQNS